MPLFRKSSTKIPDLSALRVDLHNHVLPGLDDGSPTLDESKSMFRIWEELGIKKVITTPHVVNDVYPNTREQILGQMFHMQDQIKDWGFDIELEATAEYQLDFEFRNLLNNKQVIPFGDRQHLLLEFPFYEPTYSVDEIMYDVQLAEYEPILAHPERYKYLHNDIKNYEQFKNRGILFQLNLNSLVGLYGPQPRKMAEKLVDAGMIEFVGTDAHHAEHLRMIRRVLRNSHFEKLLGSGKLLNDTL